MKYTVVWKPSVRDRLTEIWVDAPNRGAVTEAANQIDRLLQEDPEQQGEARGSGAERILVELPLAAVYEVLKQDRLVQVLSIRRVPRRPST